MEAHQWPEQRWRTQNVIPPPHAPPPPPLAVAAHMDSVTATSSSYYFNQETCSAQNRPWLLGHQLQTCLQDRGALVPSALRSVPRGQAQWELVLPSIKGIFCCKYEGNQKAPKMKGTFFVSACVHNPLGNLTEKK
ncbi:unnamed protein product [Gulo gulo]|uniref:Uncharacterized protein n=1 Tax=Gulo gulo TaxID=48420 RepID=A0A9X9LWN7_GULGU|nr:unnamed protein product [Gulo gulo]